MLARSLQRDAAARLALLAAAFLLGLSTGVQRLPAQETPLPQEVFQSIQSAWGQGNARGVQRHFGARKVSISLPETDRAGGRFSSNQAYLILKAHFAATRVVQFQFTDIRDPREPQRLAAALALRRYRQRGDGRLIEDRVLVSLAAEGERWVVSEIKALR